MLATVMVGFGPGSVGASSHREAPLIAADPTVDGTDTYAFVSPDAPTTVTLIANWIPFEEPGGGPNFYHYDDNASYYIKVDSDGDAVEDVTYKWTFHTVIKNPATFLYNTNQISGPSSTAFNYTQYYTVTQKLGNAAPTLLFGNKLMVPDNIGPRSTPNYAALAAQFVNSAGGIKEFTGQRDDPFYVDVNSIFDLGGLRPFNSLHLIPLPTSTGLDSTAGYNIHTTAIQVPISILAPTCPTSPQVSDARCVIGVWSTAERPSVITRSQAASGAVSSTASGTPIQVSRLGNPLVNEVMLPLALKDAFNTISPATDFPLFGATTGPLAGAGAILRTSILTPELANLIPVLYPAVTQKVPTPRTDLLTVFLTGIPGVTQQQNSDTTPSEQLRLNVAIPPSTGGVCGGNRIGAMAGDLAGFPNGRRLEDDVTDIAIRAVAGGYGDILGGPPPGGAGLLGLPNYSPNNTLGDGVDKNDVTCLTSFPYMGTPHAGYNRIHAAIYTSNLPASFYKVGQAVYKRPMR
jgi:hypothetical protein